MDRARKLIWLGIGMATVLLCLPSFAAADASISRSGNTMKLTSDGDGDSIHYAGTDSLHVSPTTSSRGMCCGPATAATGCGGRG